MNNILASTLAVNYGRSRAVKRQKTPPQMPLLSCTCGYCGMPFPTVSNTAEYCSDEHRLLAWKERRKRGAVVDALMDFFDISGHERPRMKAAVDRYPERFYRFMAWLGFTYKAKRYTWEAL